MDSRDDAIRHQAQQAFHEYLESIKRGDATPIPEFIAKQPQELHAELESIFADYQLLSDESVSQQSAEQGQIIGDFKLIRQIGRGGMGVVWEAEQVSLSRRVALKLLHPHYSFSPDKTDRFRREAEAGARINHPGIVSILAVGEDCGRFFMAQELVPGGRTLADWLADRRNDKALAEDYFPHLATFIAQVCDALQVAHNAGIIHRDIKPSNILIAANHQPKVADFGLARFEDRLGLSRSGQLMGTPYYMSPEQAAGNRMGLDHRTDVFSLGATMYEALTLRRPFEGDTSQQIIGRILLEDPPDPSLIRSRVPSELATICLKSLEKRPEQRYATATAMGDDLNRWLRHEPIRARQPGLGRRCLKLARRHPTTIAVSGTGVAALALTGFLLMRTVAANREARHQSAAALASEAEARASEQRANRNAEDAERARREAEASKAVANANEQSALIIYHRLEDALISSDPNQGGSLAYTVLDAMEPIIRDLQNGVFAAHPNIEAALELTIARVLAGNSRAADALDLARRALHSRQRVLAGDNAPIAEALDGVGECLESLGQLEEGLGMYMESLTMRQRMFTSDHSDVAKSLERVGRCLQGLRRTELALPMLEDALAMRRRLNQDDNDDVADSMNNVAIVYRFVGRFTEALDRADIGLAMSARLHAGDHTRVAGLHNTVANCLMSLDREAEALSHYEVALAMLRRLFTGDHPTVARALNNRGECLMRLDRAPEALLDLEAAVNMTQRLFQGDHPAAYQPAYNLAMCMILVGRVAEAIPGLEAAVAMRQRLIPGDDAEMAVALNEIAKNLLSLQKGDEALAYAEKADAMAVNVYMRGDRVRTMIRKTLMDCRKAVPSVRRVQ